MRIGLLSLTLLLMPHQGEALESFEGSHTRGDFAPISDSSISGDTSYSYSYYLGSDGITITPSSSLPCSHSECVVGWPLELGCDACITKIILNATDCGDTYWDSSCVDKVFSVCGLTTCMAVNRQKSTNDLGESVGWSIEIIGIVILVFFGVIIGFACMARYGWWLFRPKTATATASTLPIASIADESQQPEVLNSSLATPVAAPCSPVPVGPSAKYTAVHIIIDRL